MSKSTLLAISAALIAIGQELAGEEPASTPAAGGGEPEASKRGRGRPAKTEGAETETSKGMTYEELQALFMPLVKEGRGEEVKKIIAKYSPTGAKDMPAEHHAAFAKDIEALKF
jgi:hypothetical protein